jgi:hypothetical protein
MAMTERMNEFKTRLKNLPMAGRPALNHEDWRFSPQELWENLTSLQDDCGKTSLTGESICKLKELPEDAQGRIMDVLETTPWETPLPFLNAMDAHICCARVIRLAQGEVREEPLVVDLSERTSGFLPAPLIILFEAGSKGRVILRTTGTTPMVESLRIICEAGSHGFVDIFEKTEGTWAIFEQATILDKAQLTHTFLSLGHGIKRRELTLLLKGKEAMAHARSSYLSRFNDSKELLIRQRHTGEKSISLVKEKGVAADSAYNVLNGMIQVRNGAAGSEAYLTNNNLLLNDGARSHSIPRLEIEENDVKCSHSSTTSLLEPTQIFYLKSRGLSEQEARQLLIESFLEEALVEADASLVRELTQIFE